MIDPVPKAVTILDLKHSSDGAHAIWAGRMLQSRGTTPHLDELHVDSFVVASSIPDVPLRLALSNFEHLASLSSEHRNTQTDS